MKLEFTMNPRRIGLILGLVALLLAAQSLYGEYVLETVIGSESDSVPALLLDLFSVNLEESIPTWYSTLILVFASVLLSVIAFAKRASRDRYALYWLGLTLLFLYLSMDESAAIHEILSDPLQMAFNATGYLAFGWQIVAVPLVILFALLYVRFLFHLPPCFRNLFVVAGVLYAGGALVVEGISANQYSISGVTFTYLAIATVEETLEMLGVVVLIYALLSYIVEMEYVLAFHPLPIRRAQTASAFTTPEPAERDTAESTGKLLSRSTEMRRSSFLRPAVLVSILVVAVNLGLLYWGVTQAPASKSEANTPIPHYQTIIDQLVTDEVVATYMPGTFGADNFTAHQVARSLLTVFDEVMVLVLPATGSSIALAGDTLSFDQNAVTEVLHSLGETQFIIFDTAIVKSIVGDVRPPPSD
jgi:hypothetical protein